VIVKEDETKVSEIITKDVIHIISQDAFVVDAAKKMEYAGRGCLVVVSNGKPIGIVTERDLVQRVIALGKDPTLTKISQIMSQPLVSVGSDALVVDAAKIMWDNKIRRLPVINETVLTGIITVTDFAKYLVTKSSNDPMLAAMSRASMELWQTA
jgi:CBS domain-containing protein